MHKRDCVEKFSDAMEAKLQKHDKDRGEDGWQYESSMWLADRIIAEFSELWEMLEQLNASEDETQIKKLQIKAQQECVDVANFAMMTWDNLRRNN